MAIGLSILEQEDALKGLPTQALQQMMRQPSPDAPPFLVAAELKRRETMANEFSAKQAAAQTAQDAPTVAHRLAGQQQAMPMSQAGAMAAPPQQPPMPKEAQLAMALSGATGQPPPQLPTVNMQRGTSGAAMREMAKALRGEGTRSYTQRRGHQPFSSRERPPPVTPAGLALLLAAMQRQQSEPERAYGGFDISEDIRLPRGRGRTVAAARPVTAANGTQGRTVYAADGWPPPPPAPTLPPTRRAAGALSSRFPLATTSALSYLEKLAAARGGDSATYRKTLDAVLDEPGSGPGFKYGQGRQNWFNALGVGTGEVPAVPRLDTLPESERPAMTDAESAALAAALGGRLGATERLPVDQAAPLLSAEQKRLWQRGGVANPPIPQEFQGAPGPQVDADVMDFEFGQWAVPSLSMNTRRGESPTAAAPEIAAPRTSPQRAAPKAPPPASEFSGSEAIPDEVFGAGLGVLSGPPRQPLNQESRTLIPIPPAARVPDARDPQMMAPIPVAEQSVPPLAGRTGRGKGPPKTRVGEVIENLLARPDSERGIAAIASERAALAAALKPYKGLDAPKIGEPPPEPIDIETAVVQTSDGAPVTEAAAAEKEAAKAPPIPKSVLNDPRRLKMAAAPRVTLDTAGAQVATSPVDGKIVDVRDIYQTSLDQLSAGTRKAYEDMDAKLKEVSELNKADFNKLGESFKALEDFYKTGKLPERMRESRITNLLLELAKGFLGKPTMHEALEAGIAGFQAVDAKDRKQYAEGLSAMLTANQALLSAKVTMRNGELKERQALLRGRRAESLGNVQLATEQMKVASQENERVRTAAYRIQNLKVLRMNASANLLNAQTTTLQKNIKGLADADLTRIRAALERGKNDPAYRATPEYRAATEELGRKFIVGEDGTAHPDFLVYGKIVQDMTKVPSTYQAEATQSRFDSQKVAFITRIDRALAPLLEGRANTDRELWKAIAASAKIPLPKDGKIGSQWFTDNNAALRKAARLYIGGQMAGQVGYTGRMKQWLEGRGYMGQQGGAAQGEKPDPAGMRSGITGATN